MAEVDDLLAGTSGSPPAPASPGGDKSELERAKAENLQLKQLVSNLKDSAAKGAPALTALRRLAESSAEGRSLVEKILRGESLTPRQEAKAETLGLDVEGLVEQLTPRLAQEIEARLFVSGNANEGRKALEAWASKEYGESYDGMKDSAAWKRKLAKNVQELYEGLYPVDEEGRRLQPLYELPKKFSGPDGVFRWAIDQTMAQVKADNPQLGKKVKAERPSEEVEKEKVRVSSKSSGSGGAGIDELPEEVRGEVAEIRRLGTRSTVGRSYSQRRARA